MKIRTKLLIVSMLILFGLVGCAPLKLDRVGFEPPAQSDSTDAKTSFVNNLTYVRDSNTGICYAYHGHPAEKGFAFSTVPCENIPNHLLNDK